MEAFVDMHPQDALSCGVREGELACVSSRWGAMVARVQHGGGMSRGSVFVPIHWNDQVASDARAGAVVNPAVDPVSGEPEFKHTPVRVDKFRVSWHGFSLSRHAPLLEGGQATGKAIHLPTTGPVQVDLRPAQNSIGALAQNSFGADMYAYLRYKLSLCDLVEMMAERGLSLVGTMNSCAG